MKTPRRTLVSTINNKLSHHSDVKKLVREVAALLLAERRSGELPSLMRDLKQYRAEHGTVEVTAVSRHKLSDEVIKDVKNQIKALYPEVKHIDLNVRLDEHVLAGIVLEFAHQQLDLSARHKINRLKQLTIGSGGKEN